MHDQLLDGVCPRIWLVRIEVVGSCQDSVVLYAVNVAMGGCHDPTIIDDRTAAVVRPKSGSEKRRSGGNLENEAWSTFRFDFRVRQEPPRVQQPPVTCLQRHLPRELVRDRFGASDDIIRI